MMIIGAPNEQRRKENPVGVFFTQSLGEKEVVRGRVNAKLLFNARSLKLLQLRLGMMIIGVPNEQRRKEIPVGGFFTQSLGEKEVVRGRVNAKLLFNAPV
jgi:hypothetical protein